jgi:hypothetical protein
LLTQIKEDEEGNQLRVDSSVLRQLGTSYQNDKEAWKEKWTHIRKKIWSMAAESKPFLDKKKHITFVTGSKSSSIPLILKTAQLVPTISTQPALIPTGLLMQHHVTPLSGELSGGILENGINQTGLSGMNFSGLNVCIRYAAQPSYQFNPNQELDIINDATVDSSSSNISRLHIAVLRLLLMGAKQEMYEKIKGQIKILIQQVAGRSSPLMENWAKGAPLIGTVCQAEAKMPEGELQRGQIVGVHRSGSLSYKYGMIAEKNKQGLYRVIVEKDGISKWVDPRSMILVPNDVMTAEAKNVPPLTKDETMILERKVKDLKGKLEEILQLFDTIKPLNFTEEELDFIQHPFPIVWASTSDSLKVERVHQGIPDEHVVKGKAVLGKDIQVVFTPHSYVDKLKAVLKDQDVEVLSFDAAYFIHHLNLLHPSS